MLEIHYVSVCGVQRLLTDIERHVGVKHPKDPRALLATRPQTEEPLTFKVFGAATQL